MKKFEYIAIKRILVFFMCAFVYAAMGWHTRMLHVLQAPSPSKEAKSEESLLQINVSLFVHTIC